MTSADKIAKLNDYQVATNPVVVFIGATSDPKGLACRTDVRVDISNNNDTLR